MDKSNQNPRTPKDTFKTLAAEDTAVILNCTTSYVYFVDKHTLYVSGKADEIRRVLKERYAFYKASSERARNCRKPGNTNITIKEVSEPNENLKALGPAPTDENGFYICSKKG